MSTTTIVRGGRVLDVRAHRAEPADILITGDTIREVGPPGLAAPVEATVIDARGALLHAGLVNAHTHAAMALLRGIADDIALKTWLEQHIWPREARLVSPDFVHDGTLIAAGEMLLGGITCCADQYFFPDAAARAYRQSGIRALIGLPVLDFPTPYATDADGYLQVGLAARDAWKHEPKFAFALAPHAPYTVGDSSWEKIVVYARQLDLPIQTHLQETRDELEQSLRAHAMSPLARLDRRDDAKREWEARTLRPALEKSPDRPGLFAGSDGAPLELHASGYDHFA